jgi:predicted nucleotidyltransferase
MAAYSEISISDTAHLSSLQSEQVALMVKDTVQAFDPHAQVVLFGSRARGDARQDSDYDFLILLHQPVDFQLKRDVLDKLYEVELQTGCVIGALIENIDGWQRMEHSPVFSEIEQEGIFI